MNRYKDFLNGYRSNRVLHRAVGDIPGCVPAIDVLVEMSEEEVSAILKADPYWKHWDDYRHGRMGWQEWKNHPVHSRPIRSFIKNPSKMATFLGYKS